MTKHSVTTRARISYALLLPGYETGHGISVSKTRGKGRGGATCRDEQRFATLRCSRESIREILGAAQGVFAVSLGNLDGRRLEAHAGFYDRK